MTPGATVGGPSPDIKKQPSAPSAKKVKLTKCKRSGTRTVRCTARLKGAPGGTSVAVRLFKRETLLGGGSTKLSKGRGTLRIKAAKGRSLKKGAYKVLITTARRGAQPSRFERSLRLR